MRKEIGHNRKCKIMERQVGVQEMYLFENQGNNKSDYLDYMFLFKWNYK